jgi:two-component system sporulation sensor kinase A
MEDDLSSEVLESVNDSQAAASRIEYMADSLLSFARVVTHGKEHFLINTLSADAIELLVVKATKYGVNISTKFAENLPQIFADKNKLLQILLNLLTNAIESCEENHGGNILVKTKAFEKDGSVKIQWSVSDDGVGIDEVNKSQIFKDFYTSKENGTGLGLSVCKMLVDEQDAQIDFESEAGVGTTFKIIFDVNKMRKLYETENTSS